MKGTMEIQRLIATRRHTLAMTSVFLLVAIAGFVGQQASRGPHVVDATRSPYMIYLVAITFECLLVYWVWRGVRRNTNLRTMILGTKPVHPRDVVTDIGIAAVIWGLWYLLDQAITPEQPGAVAQLLPHSIFARFLWIIVSLAAGIAEELGFRGYMLTQFAAMTSSRMAGVVLQAAVFSIAHGYQGTAACARIAVFGLVMGGIALWRGNLRACMMCHAWTDIAAGLLG